MSRLRFVLRPESLCIHRLPPDRIIGLDAFGAASWYSVTRTNDELSVIAPEDFDPGPGDRQSGWRCLQIADTLAFDMVGVIAGIARVLAEANISIFTISTYNTDHILVRKGDVERAATFLALWVAARVIVFHPITAFREISDHVGLNPGGLIGFSRNHPFQSVFGQIFHPHHNGYHLLHHLTPRMPFHALPRAHALLMQWPRYAEGEHCDAYFAGGASAVRSWVSRWLPAR